MAEPILGQALALQSEFRPDTSQVLTRAVDKIGNVTLKKQLAAQKAAEAKAKREQEIAGMVKLDGAKVNTHFAQDVKDVVADSYAKMIEASQRGDIIAVNQLKTEADIKLKNLVQQSEDQEKYKSLEQQGYYIPPQVKTALSLPRAQGQQVLSELYKKNPELQNIISFDQYGNYTYKPVKNLDLDKDFQARINAMDNLFVPTSEKSVNERTKDELQVYAIPDNFLRTEAKMLAQDPDVIDIISLKHKPELMAIVDKIKQANPKIDNAEAVLQGVEQFVYQGLQSRSKKTVKSNIPQGKGGLGFNIGGGIGELSLDMDGNPTNGVIPIQVEASTTTPGGRTVTKTFDRGVPTGNNLSFNTVEVLNTRGENVIDMETNMPLEAKMLQSTKVGDVVAVPIATKDFVGANGVNYKKGQMVDGKVLKTAMERGLASYQSMVKGIASYMGKLSGKDQMVQKSVLIPAASVRTGVISSQSGKNQEFINSLFDRAEQEASQLNNRGRSRAKTSQTPKTGTPAPKVGTATTKVDLSAFDKTKK